MRSVSWGAARKTAGEKEERGFHLSERIFPAFLLAVFRATPQQTDNDDYFNPVTGL